jgi:hypothetical protein
MGVNFNEERHNKKYGAALGNIQMVGFDKNNTK